MFRLVSSVLLALPVLAGAAQAQTFNSRYTVSYLGLPVARSEFTSRFSGDGFSVQGSFSSSGLARIFDSTEGSARISGRFVDGRTQPDRYDLSFRDGSKKKRTTVAFENGTVVKTENVPPLKPRDDRVALRPGDLRAVADPLSATLVRAESLDDVCRRTLHLFDGEIRADLKLTPEGKDEWNGAATVVCKARFVPVSGYRKGKKAIEYLRDKSEIRITFAAMADTKVYAPVHASVGTQIGTITISADEMARTD